MGLDRAAELPAIQLKKSRHELIEPGIILMEVDPGVFFELEDAEQAHEAHLRLSSGGVFSILLDTRLGFFNVSPEAKKKIGSAEYARYMMASAFVVTSLPTKLAGNFYIKFVKPAAPTRLFNDREEALGWLRRLQTTKPPQQP